MSKSTASKSRLRSESAWAKGPPLSTFQNARSPGSTKSAWARGPPVGIKDATTRSNQASHAPTPLDSMNPHAGVTTAHPSAQPSKLAWTKGPPASEKPFPTSVAIDSTLKTIPAVSSQARRVVNWGTIEAVQQDLDELTFPSKRLSQDVGAASPFDSTTTENARYRPPSLQRSTARLPAKSAWLNGPPPSTHTAPPHLEPDNVPSSQTLPASIPEQSTEPKKIRNTIVPSFSSHARSSSLSKPAKLEILRMFQTQGEPPLTSDNPPALSQPPAPRPYPMNSNRLSSYSSAVSNVPDISQETTGLPATPSQRNTLDIRKLFQSSPSPASSSFASSSSSQYSFQSLFSPLSASPASTATSFRSSENLSLPISEQTARPLHENPRVLRPTVDRRDSYSFPPSPSNMHFVNNRISNPQILHPLGRTTSSQSGFYPTYQVPPPLTRQESRSSIISPVPVNFNPAAPPGPVGATHDSSIDDLDGDPTLPAYEPPSTIRERPSSGYYDSRSVINPPYSTIPPLWSPDLSAREPGERLGDTLAGLEAINFRLQAAFRDEAEYRQLLSVGGLRAQYLLDTFQMLLDTYQPDGEMRRNLIVATRRLSTKTDLYPRSFDLNGVQFNSSSPFASGSFADIHMGQLHGETVCLKIIRVYQSSVYKHIVKTTAREAILWGQLSHPNLLPFYGLHRIGSQLALVSPWADNGRIVDYLGEHPDADRVLLVSDIVEGLAYLHANDVVHGDLKGANVLVDKVGRAYLADFGLSAVTDPQILQWTSNSSAASRGGTVRYQAPELNVPESIEGEESEFGSTALHIHNTTASDIYALSCVCYEVLTGRLPFFEFAREHTVMVNVGAGIRPSRPATFIDQWKDWGLSDGMWDLLTDCWKHEPSERPPIDEVALLVSLMKPADTRSPSDWVDSATRLRGSSAHLSRQPLSLEELENILAS